MDKTLRSILWVLVALVLLSSFSAGWFFVAKERLYDEYLNLEDLFRTSMERLNREIATANKKNVELNAKLQEIERDMTALEAKHKDIQFQYEEAVKEKDQLDEDVYRLKKAKVFLEKRLKEMGSDKFIAGLLKEKASFEVELRRLKESLQPKDIELENLKEENLDLKSRLSSLTEERKMLQAKVDDSSNVAQILSRDLLSEKNRNKEDKEEMEKAKVENKVLKTRISELERTADRLDAYMVEKENMILKISKLERVIENKEDELNKLKIAMAAVKDSQEARAEAYHSPSEVDLPPIVLKREATATDRGRYGESSSVTTDTPTTYKTASLERISSPPYPSSLSSLEGRVVTVNREHDFVVINIGRQDGVRVGFNFDIYRNNTIIGSVKVIQLRERIAAADIDYVADGYSIEIDDKIVKR